MLHLSDGRDIIIELNDCGTGTVYKYQDEDLQHIKETLITRMNNHIERY